MSPELVDLLKTVLGTITVLGSAGGVGTLVYKKRPSKTSSLAEEVALLRGRVTAAETTATAAGEDAAATRAEMRLLTDYVHDLREHIALGRKPPPPDWPEGLRL